MRKLGKALVVALVVGGLLMMVGGAAQARDHRARVSFVSRPPVRCGPVRPVWRRPVVPFGGYGYYGGFRSPAVIYPRIVAPVVVSAPVYYPPVYYQPVTTGLRVISTPTYYTPTYYTPTYYTPTVYRAPVYMPPPVCYPAGGGIRISVSW